MIQDQSCLIDSGVAALRSRFGDGFPKSAVVLGSGLGGFANTLSGAVAVAYEEIPGFSTSTVAGHPGKLIVGKAGEAPVAVMQGRIHAYEGYSREAMAAPIRILRKLGVERIVLTNTSGGLRRELKPGTLVAISDHINPSGFSPLMGPNDDSIGPRFPDMTDPYDSGLRAKLLRAAHKVRIQVKTGIYVFALGPSFETAAEIRMLAKWGADVVGMSTVPECLVARHCGMKVVAISAVTNYATGISKKPLTHEETLAEAERAAKKLEPVLRTFLQSI